MLEGIQIRLGQFAKPVYLYFFLGFALCIVFFAPHTLQIFFFLIFFSPKMSFLSI